MTDAMKAGESHSIVDDFMYGSNVAAAHVYIRMGKAHSIDQEGEIIWSSQYIYNS